MTERPQDDPTRDIRLPPLPGSPPPSLPREWAAADRSPSHVVQAPARAGSTSLTELSTDELGQPDGRPRERTIAFASPEMAPGRPAPTVGRTPRRARRWPMVVLALVPLLVIATAGVLLVVLLRG